MFCNRAKLKFKIETLTAQHLVSEEGRVGKAFHQESPLQKYMLNVTACKHYNVLLYQNGIMHYKLVNNNLHTFGRPGHENLGLCRV